MFTDEVSREIRMVADEFAFEPAALLAIAEVESGGRAFAMVDGRAEPMIRFEGHYFDRLLSDDNRARARTEGLASPNTGAVANPATQAARWRLVARAARIDRKAAYESVSWGLGQVMGSHWAWLGFASVDELVAEARGGAAGQARLMARYLDRSGLAPVIGEHDWEAVARAYNGPAYRKNSYHLKLAAAYERQAAAAGNGSAAPPLENRTLLRRGAKGQAVRDLQRSLSALGYPVKADSVFGAATENAVRAFQRDHRLARDGIAGPKTFSAMARAMPLGAWLHRIWAFMRAALVRLAGFA